MLGVSKFHVSLLLGFMVCMILTDPLSADCWETGCQLDTWLVTGCQEYGRIETKRRPCDGGTHFTCCSSSQGGGVSSDNSGVDCWETGCQLNSWAVVGCEQYGRSETKRRPCDGGTHFTCCLGSPGGGDGGGSVGADCWETGCQLNSWAVVGCEQYGRKEVRRRPCNGGTHFTCCPSDIGGGGKGGGGKGGEGADGGGKLDKYGDMTYYNLGMTACGQVYKDTDFVVAIAFGYWTTANPNLDPICGRQIKIVDPTSGKEVIVKVVDKCGGCKMDDVDVSPTAFQTLRDLGVGRFKVKWGFI